MRYKQWLKRKTHADQKALQIHWDVYFSDTSSFKSSNPNKFCLYVNGQKNIYWNKLPYQGTKINGRKI